VCPFQYNPYSSAIRTPTRKDLDVKPFFIISLCSALLIGLAPNLNAKIKTNNKSNDFVVAIVNGTAITESEVKVFYTTLPPQYKKIPYQQIRDKLIQRIIEQTLIAEAAIKSKLHEDKVIRKQIAIAERSVLNEAYLSNIVKRELSDAKVRGAYQKSIALQPKQTEVRARHILVKSKSEAARIISLLRNGADFVKLAREKSIGPSGKNGGDLGFFGKGQMVPPFSKAAFALEKGQFTTEPVKTQFGFHIIKVVDRRTAGRENYDQALSKIRNKLLDKIFDKSISALRAKAKIELISGASKIQPIH